MCCGNNSSKNKVATTFSEQQQAKAAIPASSEFQKANPFVIPKSVKKQLIINQQMVRIPKK